MQLGYYNIILKSGQSINNINLFLTVLKSREGQDHGARGLGVCCGIVFCLKMGLLARSSHARKDECCGLNTEGRPGSCVEPLLQGNLSHS